MWWITLKYVQIVLYQIVAEWRRIQSVNQKLRSKRKAWNEFVTISDWLHFFEQKIPSPRFVPNNSRVKSEKGARTEFQRDPYQWDYVEFCVTLRQRVISALSPSLICQSNFWNWTNSRPSPFWGFGPKMHLHPTSSSNIFCLFQLFTVYAQSELCNKYRWNYWTSLRIKAINTAIWKILDQQLIER